jgi:hypothetical protein
MTPTWPPSKNWKTSSDQLVVREDDLILIPATKEGIEKKIARLEYVKSCSPRKARIERDLIWPRRALSRGD